jgi:hypothetical protein
MTRRFAGFVLSLSAASVSSLIVFSTPVVGSQTRPLPAPEPFYSEVRANLTRADREQYRYAYRERRSEVHTNPFGKIGTGGTLLYQVTPGNEYGIYHRRLIERDGKALTEEKPETVDRRGRSETNPAVDDVVKTLTFEMEGRETAGDRDVIVVRFTPKPEANPRTRQGKMAKAFKGTIWIDEAAKEVVRLEATAIDNLSYGGVLARLNEGTTVKLLRAPIDGAIWLPTSIRLAGQGRAMLIRKLDIDYVIEWLDYARPPGSPGSPGPPG